MFGTRTIEIAASLCGLANVVLIIRRSLWNYPFGLVMVTLYAWIFYDAKLYSDALLQVLFFVIQVFGLWWWISGRTATGALIVLRLSARQWRQVLAATALGVALWGWAMAELTDAALPWWDAAIAGLSLAAQVLLSRRYLENWIFWIAVDVLAIGVYLAKDLQPTAVLYTLFLGLAIKGLADWRATWRKQTP
ncbi:nicotinamide riboside transporter PnuC [Stagnihabitans tardus]|uniref:Nicotinamide riboside transporter PnuC n=1 Tax=Stagnihabitans tardus TaxID=2699202 RepID=A0AAE5BU75_9RHOB|nr:nicotinamide riboside transporter PnuC [Stagnihabitans tardus]NBZ89855.1 nicotinamide riboside transporter PnuC [Stagnihabitans tardus]